MAWKRLLVLMKPWMLIAGQANTCHAHTVDQFESERLGKQTSKYVRFHPVVDENSSVNESTDHRNSHDRLLTG